MARRRMLNERLARQVCFGGGAEEFFINNGYRAEKSCGRM